MQIRDGLSYDDVLLVPKRSPVTDLNAVNLTTRIAPGLELGLPILSAPMDAVTEGKMAGAMAEHGGLGVIHRFLTVREQANEVAQVDGPVAAAIGVNESFVDRAAAVLEAGADCLVIDIAHGHLDRCLDAVREVRQEFGDVPLVAGNVATREAVADFAAAGADCVKVGIGPGSHCTTRRVAGAGVPQLTAVTECATAAAEHGIHTIADGGIRSSGEIVKALMAGADAVMVGGLLMGTDETPGPVIERDGERFKATRGMASREARERRTDKPADDFAAEGVEALAPYKGSVGSVLAELRGGVRSGISYCGADNLVAAREQAEFVRTSPGAKAREGPHGHGLVAR